jgi:P-type conjugative transfer protein TrbJ
VAKTKLNLAAKIILVSLLVIRSAHGQGIPVTDVANFQQSALSAAEAVAQTLKQIEQYQTQLQQYENMLVNTAAPAAYVWDQAQRTINKLVNTVDTLNHYEQQLGSLDAVLNRFQNVSHYRSSHCFGPSGCTEEQARTAGEADQQSLQMSSEMRKNANDALLRTVSEQQTSLKNDAATLERLQVAAQGATGQVQAIGYANQLASQQSHQLLQMRGLLIAQQNALGMQMQAQADKEARDQAHREHLYRVGGPSNLPFSNESKGY